MATGFTTIRSAGTPKPAAPTQRPATPQAGRGVLLAHPGTQHSYRVALALQQAGLLQRFLNGFYYRPDGAAARILHRFANSRGAALEHALLRRFQPGLDPRYIESFVAPELLYLASTRLRPLRAWSEALLRRRNDRFDAWVAERLERERPAAVLCFNTSAQRAFEHAKSLGIACVLDQSVAHIRAGLELFREEAALHPDFADSLPRQVPAELVERCERETQLADCILSPSEYVRSSLLAAGVEPSRIAALPYGVDPLRFRPAPRRDANLFRVLFVGQLSQRKGIKYLLEAFRRLRLSRAELVLAGGVIGSGKGLVPYRDVFRHVPWIAHAEVHEYFHQADVFVYPSLHEGSALAIYEALASGLPVITTPNSGSVVRDAAEGFLVPIRSVEALEEKILLLYRDAELRREMGLRARARAQEFTWAVYGQRLVETLRRVMALAEG